MMTASRSCTTTAASKATVTPTLGGDRAGYLASGIGEGTRNTRRLRRTNHGTRDGGQSIGKGLRRRFRRVIWPTAMPLLVGFTQNFMAGHQER